MGLSSVSENIKFLLNGNTFSTETLTDGTNLFAYEWGSKAQGGEIHKQVLVLDGDAFPTPLKGVVEQPTFQIWVRGNKNDSGKTVHDLARDIFEFIQAQPSQTIDGVDYLPFEPTSGMVPLNRDENGRFRYMMQFYTFRNSED